MASGSKSQSLKEYLKKYQDPIEEDHDHKKKKKKKKKTNKKKSNTNTNSNTDKDPNSVAFGGVCVVDEDPVWAKPIKLDDDEQQDDSPDEEKPLIDEDVEVKRLKRLEAIRARRPYLAISEDGSGWVSVSDASKQENSMNEVPDMSPPRRERARFDTPSPEAKLSSDGVQDLYPPRQQRRRYDSPSPEPQQNPSLEPDGDLSPRRRYKSHMDSSDHRINNSDLSPPRHRHRHYVSPSPPTNPNSTKSLEPYHDLSPPRRSLSQNDSPTNRAQNSDLSPPRQCRRRYDSLSPEPSTNLANSPEDHDLSPPRHSRHSMDSTDLRTKNTDLSPPRQRRRRYDSPTPAPGNDLSPPRRSRTQLDSSDDKMKTSKKSDFVDRDTPHLSPPYRSNFPKSPLYIEERKGAEEVVSPDLSPLRKNKKDSSSTKAGQSAGLISAQEIKEEIERKKKEDLSRILEMDPSVSGRDAENVYRLHGKRISKEEYLKLKRGEEKPKEIKLEWGKGLAQKREAEARERELELEKDKPFARTRDDPELDKILKERIRWGDPMAHLVKRKKPDLVLEDLGEDEKMKESGFLIPQTIPSHSWLKRGIDAPGNRYGIRPGRHWDGVDRSNGYEKELFKRQNEKQATEREAYIWSVSDM